ncbi:unnamed protein product [Linum trigynum]|uniref:Uncharacterized protein n=1 Tax=Linum trigynum TaxID=586398 RepID=A0AAV2G513_9ROSI
MAIGFKFYGESHTIIFDLDKGLFWGTNSEAAQLERNGFVASEKIVWDYLTEHGVNSKIKSVKLVEPKFPKNRMANDCYSLLRRFTEAVVEENVGAEDYRNFLVKYCGVEIH